MTNFKNNSENFTGRPGLYRVWVPLRDDGESPLISIWVDPTFRAFEPCVEEKILHLDERARSCRSIEQIL
jgi:hypothetical protein